MREKFSKNAHIKMKIICVAAAVCITVLSLAACSGTQPLPEQFDEAEVKAEAQKAIEYFNNQDYQSIIDMGSDKFQDSITLEEFHEQCKPYHEKCGEYKEITKSVTFGNVDQSTQKAYGIIVLIGAYEKGNVQFNIGFDEDMKIVQFYIK